MLILRQTRVPAVFMRGGTSKGVFFREDALPEAQELRDEIFQRALGSPDPYAKQIDGLGGATSSTSKAVVVGPSARTDSDVDYLFAQVAVDKPVVDYSGNCGNLSSAVGPFAIEEGIVPATDPLTVVRIWQVNTRKRIVARVPTEQGLPVVEGNYTIDGVPGSGAEIRVEFLEPGGSAGNGLLPTGNVVDTLPVPGVGDVKVTLLDAANPVVFMAAESLGLTGTELPSRVDGDPELIDRLERIRAHGAVAMGLAETAKEASERRPGTPKVAFVGRSQPYESQKGERVRGDEIDVVARIISMGRLHHAFAVTGAVATGIAAVVDGSVVQQASGLNGPEHEVRIGHPSGMIRIGATVSRRDGEWFAEKAIVSRTARRLMEGSICLPSSVRSR